MNPQDMTPQDMYRQTKQRIANSKGQVSAANRKLQTDEYAKFAKTAGKKSKWSGDPDIEADYKLQQMVGKLRKQFPEMEYANLVELAKMQLGIIDPGKPGKAQPKQEPSQGTPYGTQPPGPPSPAQPQPSQSLMPFHGKPYAPPPEAKGGATVHSFGGSKVAYPGWMADEKSHQLWADRQKREMEIRQMYEQSQETSASQEMKRQREAMEMQKLQEEMAYEKFMRDLEIQKAKRAMEPMLGGLLAPASDRKPVTYLGG